MRKQGTIKTFDGASRTGVILDDQKNEIAFTHESFEFSGLREFRLGQRVKFDVSGEPPKVQVRDLTILTL